MMLKCHKTLTIEKWSEFPVFQQILMIANELNRANNWIRKKDFPEVKRCYERAFELVYLTADVSRKRNFLRELLRFKEMLAQAYTKNEPNELENNLLLKCLVTLNGKSFAMLHPPPK